MTRTILIVDDDPTIREITSLTLSHIGGHLVREASSGADAAASAAAEPPDAILLDVMMPGLDGPSTLACLRADERTARVPVVFLTAKLLPAERQRLERLDVHGVIAKPFDAMQLVSDLHKLLGW